MSSSKKIKGQHPMMASTRRREKEVVALAFNQKEQRVLEKSLATIRLEASYSMKLLDLHNRSVKVHFRQMKDKVSRIKSHLPPDEIHKLRQMEAEGKLQPMYTPVSLGSALKIAAAARRLNSSHGKKPPTKARAKSALPRVNLPDQGHSASEGLAPPPGALKRSNSVSGAFIDAPPPRGGSRPNSANVAVGRTSPSSGMGVGGSQGGKEGTGSVLSVNSRATDSRQSWSRLQMTVGGTGRPGSSGIRTSPNQLQIQQNGTSSSSSMESQQSKRSGSQHSAANAVAVDPQQSKRPGSYSNVNGHGHGHSELMRSRKNSVSTSHSKATGSHAHAPFSSHVVTEKEAREREENGGEAATGQPLATPRSNHGSLERNSSFLGLNDDTVDDLGEDLYAERRAELLEEEQYRAASITRRKDRFLKEIDRYLREHPPLRSLPLTPKHSPKDEGHKSGQAAEGGLHGAVLIRRRRVEFDTSPTYLPEADYRDRLMGLWRDMNRCRYLRVPDEMIDLSGINTLATDTMKLFQVLKQRDMEPLANAWVE